MLKSVSISNLALISQLRVDFHSGLNLLTGETGAGKSIVVDALGLLTGVRAWSDLIRTGEEAAVVEGVFEFTSETERLVRARLSEIGVVLNQEEYLTVRREVQANGRNRVFINHKNVTLTTLRSLQPLLIEIHGQGEQRSLFDPRAQLQLLDTFGECDRLRKKLEPLYQKRREILRSIQSSLDDVAQRNRLSELLRYQLEEIGRFETYPGEKGALLEERHLLLHSERVSQLSRSAFGELYEEDGSVLTLLKSTHRKLHDLAAIDKRLGETLNSIENAELLLKDAAEELRRFNDGLIFNPDRLNQIETRLVEFERMERKYGCQADELIELREQLEKRLDELVNWDKHNSALEEELASVRREYVSLAKKLSACRRKAAPAFVKKVSDNLKLLAMEQAAFQINLDTAADNDVGMNPAAIEQSVEGEFDPDTSKETYWSPVGADRVEFWLSANPGESLRPLSRVASGGELSRLMLILRTVSRSVEDNEAQTTLVFDEIDSGIGGRVAETVGQRLKTLAAGKQVFCVTHQAQIARFADHHFAVTKNVSEGRTETTVKELTADERVGELARMIGGSAEVEASQATARWLINSARDFQSPAEEVASGSEGKPSK